ncbi:hypothetical protein SLEP1_g59961 [Rubroshorea leprosula]|uniref:Uncharacterized protein n=1 Tax=Rubroshorea leprosula TaxID=152421 RepID=A0AAV5MV87_9ROSI|nr:hypothetical protein SLEP1_g59961 [Rubroshorea leprosula]
MFLLKEIEANAKLSRLTVDRLSLTFDGEPITLSETYGAKWHPESTSNISITRASVTNNVVIKVEGNFKITAKVVPITEEDSRIHNYGVTKEDCFAHLDLEFKFYSLSDKVKGVLGQTYKPGYKSGVNIGAQMPVMGGDRKFETTSISAPDCAVAQFSGIHGDNYFKNLVLPGLNCASGVDGHGVICQR